MIKFGFLYTHFTSSILSSLGIDALSHSMLKNKGHGQFNRTEMEPLHVAVKLTKTAYLNWTMHFHYQDV